MAGSSIENRERQSRILFREGFDRRDWILFALLMASALLLRLPNLGESLWFDEVIYTSLHLKGGSFDRILFYDVHPPLYPLLMRGWIELFGDGEISVRLPSLLLGLLSIGLLFSLARRWFDRGTAILAGSLLALSPVHIWYSQETKNNMLLLLLSLLTLYTVYKAWIDNRRRSWILFICSALAAVCTNRFALWTVCAAFVWLWLQVLRKDGRRHFRAVLTSSVVFAIAYLPLLLKALLQMDVISRAYLRPFTLSEVYPLFLVYLSHGNTLRTISPYASLHQFAEQPWYFFSIDGFFAFLIGMGFFAHGRRILASYRQPSSAAVRDREISELLAASLVIPPIALLAASLLHQEIYVERSMIILLAPLAVLIASGTIALKVRWMRHVALVATLSLGFLALYNLWIAKAEIWTVYKPNPDWRSAAAYLERENRDSIERFFVLQSAPNDALAYHYRRLAESRLEGREQTPAPELPGGHFTRYEEGKFLSFLSQFRIRTLYLIHNRYWSENFEEIHRAVEQSQFYEGLSEKRYKGLVIYKYRVLLR